MNGLRIGFALCGSFCTISKAMEQMRLLQEKGAQILPILSETVSATDTRFGTAKQLKQDIFDITGVTAIDTVKGAEPIGPKGLLDALVIAPATGNTIAKIAGAVTDTAVTMAAKATLRNEKPVVVCTATNDGLGASAKNIGILMAMRGIYLVPLRQDDPVKKPTSVVADFSQLLPTLREALAGRQIQPLLSVR